MNTVSIDHIVVPVDRQIARLGQLTEKIHAALCEEDSVDMAEILEDLGELANSLTELTHRVTHIDEERENLLALASIGQVVNSTLDLDDVLRIVMDTIVRLTGAERGFLMLRDAHGALNIRLARNWEQETLEPSEAALSHTVVNRVINEGEPVLTTNAQADPRFGGQDSVIALNLRSILCVPLKMKGEVIGVIYADNRVRTGLFTEIEKNILAAFANQAAVAIENARLFESVKYSLLQVSELKNLMEDVFSSIASGVITTDLEDCVTLTNRAAEAILGVGRSELLGRRVSEVHLLGDLNIPHYLDGVRQHNRQIIGLQFTPAAPGRAPLSLRFNLSPLKDVTGTTRGVVIVMEDITETRRLEAQRRLFERMVSPLVIDQLNPDELHLGGTRTHITTLFADIRGFTSLSERTDPETLVAVLNRYLGVATEAVLAEEGTIDKFLGDAVMAFFNAPIAQSDHTLRAVRAALRMISAVKDVQVGLPAEFQLSIGVGIHCGEAVLGLVGTQKRLEYTAIGDSVNIAKRLQENAGEMQILISDAAYECVGHRVKARPWQSIHAKGKKEPLNVFEVLSLS
jgi:PAS domain S-box-containing protein